jgi:carbonic anhydrase
MAISFRHPIILPTLMFILGSLCGPSLAEEHKAPAPAPTASPTKKIESAPPAKTAAPAAIAAPATPVGKPTVTAATSERPAAERAPVKAEAPAAEPVRSRPPVAAAPRRVALPSPRPGEMAKVVEESTAEAAHAAKSHTKHWSYEGDTGPHAWAKLAPEYAKCGNGQRQSPIDIRDGMRVELEPVAFEYRPSGFRVVDNGHTIQANVNGWNSIRVMGRRYRLEQFHFHRPSEEMIDGKQFEMVVHLVHKDGEGRLAVVAVLVEVGARQPVIQAVLNNLPLERGDEITANANLDLAQLLPGDRRYFTYMGSLTTPPCTEDVLWIVMKQPVQATVEQLDLFSRMYPMNARPIQSSSGRTIKESN